MVDLSKIKPKKHEDLAIDPYEIFRKNISRMSDSGVNDLWAGQVDALREWHKERTKNDVCLVLNTGAGKTLLGGLISQSLVNETRGKILYVCSSIQLIEQTRDKFESYGLKPTTYYDRNFSNDNFNRCQSVCITTYQALFNGRSRFFNEDISAIIFDDAHTAEGMIKNHYSLDIRHHDFPLMYNGLCAVFQSYFNKMGRSGTFSEIRNGQNSKVELIHPTEILNNLSVIRDVLESGGVASELDTKFSWAHIKDNLEMCAFFISTGTIQIVPAFIPVIQLPYFSNSIRRVYLTATMLGEDAFIRTFGKSPDLIIKPDTPAGQCERLILFPGNTSDIHNDFLATQELIQRKKALIIAPNKTVADKWSEVAVSPSREAFPQKMQSFKDSFGTEKLVVTARYDGIDLPGNTCRVLVLDGLPKGSSLIDKYQWESLKLVKSLRSVIACRVVQSLGRISRGMTDFGVVIVMDNEYVKWLAEPKNQSCLPAFVQKQLELGYEVSSNCIGFDDLLSMTDKCLNRDDEWLDTYDEFMEGSDSHASENTNEELVQFARAEVKFAQHLWERNYPAAIKSLSDVLNDAFSVSDSLGAWYAHWLGYSYELSGDDGNARALFQRAAGVAKTLPKAHSSAYVHVDTLSEQAVEILNQFSITGGASIDLPRNMHLSLQGLDQSASVNQTEESLRMLGQYLGLDASRPDKEEGAGPDVLWVGAGVALCIEAKSGKKVDVNYSKKYVGQLMNHIQWVEDRFPEAQIIPLFVGPELPCTDSASPTHAMRVVSLDSFQALSTATLSAYEDISARAIPLDLGFHVTQVMTDRKLLWSDDVLDVLALKSLKSMSG